MEELSIQELQMIEKQILIRFDEICRQNNLKYSIAYGTLLGAVRHHGFIPWDDDVDVVMPREDYEKLMEMQYCDERYRILNYRYSDNYYYPFAKMIDCQTNLKEFYRVEQNMGVFLDIFPLDYFKSVEDFKINFSKRQQEYNVIMRNGFLINRSTTSSFCLRSYRKIRRAFIAPFRKYILQKYENKYCLSDKDGCSVMAFAFTDNINDILPINIWDSLKYMSFENIKVLAFQDYDYVLTCCYGDYMKLPPMEKRISAHDFSAHYIEKPKDSDK